ncbi:MAG: nickel pincer cofactor biosynthesis protein LarC [Eubacteriaceae bacterium]
MKILKIDCFAGAAGDMFLGAFADLGMDTDFLQSEIGKLGLPIRLDFEESQRNGLTGCRCSVIDERTGADADLHDSHHDHHHADDGHCEGHDHNHADDGHCEDHDHDHYHADDGRCEEHDHDHHHANGEHCEGHDHHHDQHQHHHEHRRFAEIREIIESSGLSGQVKSESIRVFERLAVAEGQVHGKPANEVAFHEAGALDSIADIVGTVICIDWFRKNEGIERIYCSPVNTGSGFVHCAHGLLPVPVPAVMGVLEGSGIPIYQRDIDTEALTPTGAVILACYAQYDPNLICIAEKRGVGFGTRIFRIPNALRIVLGDTEGIPEDASEIRPLTGNGDSAPEDYLSRIVPGTTRHVDSVVQIETQVDDMTGEEAGFLMERLMETEGILDAYWTGITMKKSRPGILLTVLCRDRVLENAAELILRNSSAIGLRYFPAQRIIMAREIVPVQTRYGEIHVKTSCVGAIRKAYPEYEDMKTAALNNGVSIREIQLEVMKAFQRV